MRKKITRSINDRCYGSILLQDQLQLFFAKSDDDNKLTVWAWDQKLQTSNPMQIAADQYAKRS